MCPYSTQTAHTGRHRRASLSRSSLSNLWICRNPMLLSSTWVYMIWRMATPTAEDRQTQDGTPYKWSGYVHKVSSIILARHGNAHPIVCVNDPYNTAYSTKDDERDLRVQGRAHVPNIYMKLGNPFPSAREFKTLISNKGRLQKLICSYLTDLAQNVDPCRDSVLSWLSLHELVGPTTIA